MRLHSPALAEAFTRGPRRRGLPRPRHRDGRHRDGLLRDRLAGARRRRVGDRLPQSQGVGRLQAPARGRTAPSPGTSGIQDVRRVAESQDSLRAVRRGLGRARGRLRGVPAVRARLHRPERDPADGARPGRRQRHGRADDRPDPRRLPRAAGAALLRAERRVPRPRAKSASAGEPQADHRHRARARAPSSGSPGTATPTGASSSTTRASSCPATS